MPYRPTSSAVLDAWIAGYKKNGKIKTYDEWKRCASLAIIWNDCKAGQHRIFNAENDIHLQVSHWQYQRTIAELLIGGGSINRQIRNAETPTDTLAY